MRLVVFASSIRSESYMSLTDVPFTGTSVSITFFKNLGTVWIVGHVFYLIASTFSKMSVEHEEAVYGILNHLQLIDDFEC